MHYFMYATAQFHTAGDACSLSMLTKCLFTVSYVTEDCSWLSITWWNQMKGLSIHIIKWGLTGLPSLFSERILLSCFWITSCCLQLWWHLLFFSWSWHTLHQMEKILTWKLLRLCFWWQIALFFLILYWPDI